MKRLAIVFIILVLAIGALGCNELTRPAVPVVVTMRWSAVGVGLVAQLHNQTNAQLTVSVVIRSEKTNQTKEATVNIPANGTTEIGWAEGLPFGSGETLTISHPNYANKTLTTPEMR